MILTPHIWLKGFNQTILIDILDDDCANLSINIKINKHDDLNFIYEINEADPSNNFHLISFKVIFKLSFALSVR